MLARFTILFPWQVVVQGLYSTDNCHSLVMDTPVRSVALDPLYHKSRSGRRFVVGMTCVFFHYISKCKLDLPALGEA